MTPAKEALLERLRVLLERAEVVTFVAPDDTGFFAIEDEMVADVRRLMEETLGLMRDIMALYDEEVPDGEELQASGDSAEDGFLKEIGAAISSELAAQEVASLAFATRTQLMESYEALEGALRNGYIWVVASNADTGLRRVGKGLIALETAIREYEGLPPVSRHWSDIEDSLETRRLYGQLRRAILRHDPARNLDQLRRQMRSAANRIAILRKLEIYPFLRVYDRVPLRRLQKRIRAWLERPDDDPEKEQDGRRLWSDLTSFAELLAQINHREDLREHDRRTLLRLRQALFEGSRPVTELGQSHIRDLERLEGRDDELDRILFDPSRHELEEVRPPLERILEQLNKPYEPVDASGSPF